MSALTISSRPMEKTCGGSTSHSVNEYVPNVAPAPETVIVCTPPPSVKDSGSLAHIAPSVKITESSGARSSQVMPHAPSSSSKNTVVPATMSTM